MSRYKVWASPGSTDDPNQTAFMVQGADVTLFARMHELARTMQRCLNAPQLSPQERNAVRIALGFATAGESGGWSDSVTAAMKRAQEKLSP